MEAKDNPQKNTDQGLGKKTRDINVELNLKNLNLHFWGIFLKPWVGGERSERAENKS